MRRDPVPSNDPEILTVPEVAELLRIGRNQAYELVRTGTLRCVRLGSRTIRVPRVAIIELLGAEGGTKEDAPGLGGVSRILRGTDDHRGR